MAWMMIIAFELLAADQALKLWAQNVLTALPGGQAPLLDGVMDLQYVRNTGAAYGLLQGRTLFFIIINTIVLIALLILLYRMHKRKIALLNAALLLIFAGGVGNLIDRVARGYVVDLFHFLFVEFPVFNLADVMICIGTALLLLFILFFYEKYFPHQTNASNKDAAMMEKVDADE